jgi:RNA recognition motif-containing protein
MGKKLYVGNIAYGTTEDGLRELFAQAGEVVSVAVIMDRETGRSKGFGFVEMATEEAAQQAITQFNEYQYEGRQIRVAEARPQTDRPPRREGPGAGDRGY